MRTSVGCVQGLGLQTNLNLSLCHYGNFAFTECILRGSAYLSLMRNQRQNRTASKILLHFSVIEICAKGHIFAASLGHLPARGQSESLSKFYPTVEENTRKSAQLIRPNKQSPESSKLEI